MDSHYFDTATIGHSPQAAIQAHSDYLQKHKNTIRKSIYKSSRLAQEHYIGLKEELARIFGGQAENFGYIQNVDLGSNILIESLVMSRVEKFYTTIFESHSLISPLFQTKADERSYKLNLKLNQVDSWPINELLDNLSIIQETDNLEKNRFSIVLGSVSPVYGRQRELVELAKYCKDLEGILVVDLSQTIADNVLLTQNKPGFQSFKELPNSIVICDGSKNLLGPTNSGFTYVSPEVLEDLPQPFPSAGNINTIENNQVIPTQTMERMEVGQPDLAAMTGLVKSVQYLQGKSQQINPNTLESKLEGLDGIDIINPGRKTDEDPQNERASIICVTSKLSDHDLALLLDEIFNVQVRSGLICTHQGLKELNLEGVLQISTHVYTDHRDLGVLCDGLEELLSQ